MEESSIVEVLVEDSPLLAGEITTKITKISPRIRFVERRDIVSTALRYVERNRKVLVVAEKAWSLWRLAAEDAKKHGLNHFLLEALDPREIQLMDNSLEKTLEARLAYFSKIPSEKAVLERKDLDRVKVDRRTVFAKGISVALEYKEKPIKTDLCKFRELSELCERCFSACSGDPCVASYSLCSLDVVSIPSYSREALYHYLEVLKPRSNSFIIFAPRSVVGRFLEILEKNSLPSLGIVIVPIGCPYAVGLEELLYLRYMEFIPLLLDEVEEPIFHDDYCTMSRELYASTVAYDYKKLTNEPLIVELDKIPLLLKELYHEVENDMEKYRYSPRARKAAIEYLVKRHGRQQRFDLETFFVGNVYVDSDRCTLCSACARECPTNALLFSTRADREELVFRHERCISCYRCVEVCPHSAISLRKEIDLARIGLEQVLVSDKAVNCLNCGKSIGSKKLVLSVIEKLKEKSISGDRIKVFYLCNECKIKYQLGLIDLDSLGDSERKTE